MRIFRYRKPSLSTLLGVSTAKRRIKRSLGISQVQGFIKPSRLKQKIKYRAGLYTPVVRAIRQTAKGKFRIPFGLCRRSRPAIHLQRDNNVLERDVALTALDGHLTGENFFQKNWR